MTFRPELDGLRGVAVLLVIGGHLYVPGLLGGGNVGVTLFFVLSGYLITSILRENDDMIRFYKRRARRLLPALIAWLGVLVMAGVVTHGEALHPLLYAANWSAATGNLAAPLAHTWSLAVEEQFYLLWPAVLLVARRPVWFVAAVMVGTSVAGVMGASNSLVGEIGRFGPIAWGCLLGLGVIPRLPRLIVLAAVGLIAAFVLFPPPSAEWSNRLGPLLSAAAFAVVAVLVRRETGPLAIPPLMAVGRISYGLYLWHAPFAFAIWPLLSDGQDRPGDLVWTLVAIAASFACAITSWVVVERRFVAPRSAEGGSRPASHAPGGRHEGATGSQGQRAPKARAAGSIAT